MPERCTCSASISQTHFCSRCTPGPVDSALLSKVQSIAELLASTGAFAVFLHDSAAVVDTQPGEFSCVLHRPELQNRDSRTIRNHRGFGVPNFFPRAAHRETERWRYCRLAETCSAEQTAGGDRTLVCSATESKQRGASRCISRDVPLEKYLSRYFGRATHRRRHAVSCRRILRRRGTSGWCSSAHCSPRCLRSCRPAAARLRERARPRLLRPMRCRGRRTAFQPHACPRQSAWPGAKAGRWVQGGCK
eukprot:SAG31_NODE_484_length_15037_cov_9.974762_7_plen_248_part_00